MSISDVRRNGIDLVFGLIVLVLIQMTARPWTVAATVVGFVWQRYAYSPWSTTRLRRLSVIRRILHPDSCGRRTSHHTSLRRTNNRLQLLGPASCHGLPPGGRVADRAARSGHRSAATGWCLAIIALLAGIYLTQSCGTFSPPASRFQCFPGLRAIRQRQGLRLLLLVLFALAVPGSEIDLWRPCAKSLPVGPTAMSTLFGRSAVRPAAGGADGHERPYFGFGPGTFPGEVPNFADRVPTAVRSAPDGAHNAYLQLAGESGFLGLIGWTTMILGFLGVVVLRILAQPRPATGFWRRRSVQQSSLGQSRVLGCTCPTSACWL